MRAVIALVVIALVTGVFGMSQTQAKMRLVNQMAEIYNNAGNIEVGQGFAGETGETYAKDRKDGKKPFVVFDSPVMGLRAVFRDLRTKAERYGGSLYNIINEFWY